MNFYKGINLEKSEFINSNICLNEDITILKISFDGVYRKGSVGNFEGMYIFSKILSAYFSYETLVSLIIDLSKLEYIKGNTLLKSLNFFQEIGRNEDELNRKIFVVVSKENKENIDLLVKNLAKSDNIIIMLNENIEQLYDLAQKEVDIYYK